MSNDFNIPDIEAARNLLPIEDFKAAEAAVRQAALDGLYVSVRAIVHGDGDDEEIRLHEVSVLEEEEEAIRYAQSGGVWDFVSAQEWMSVFPSVFDRPKALALLTKRVVENTSAENEEAMPVPLHLALDTADAALDGDLFGARQLAGNPDVVDFLMGGTISPPNLEDVAWAVREAGQTHDWAAPRVRPVKDAREENDVLSAYFFRGLITDCEWPDGRLYVSELPGVERPLLVPAREGISLVSVIGLDPSKAPARHWAEAVEFDSVRAFGWGLTRGEFEVEYLAEALRQIASGDDDVMIRHPVHPELAAQLLDALEQGLRALDRAQSSIHAPGALERLVRDTVIEADPQAVLARFEAIRNRKRFLFILGADDPEMSTIQMLLDRLDIPSVSALDDTGARVHPGNAYRAAPVYVSDPDVTPVVVENDALVLFQGKKEINRIRIDHHRPGDYGYGKGPEKYFEASSIGQVWDLLTRSGYRPERAIPEFHARLVAAADHCPAAAYQGRCPGVSPERLKAFRISTRAAFLGIEEGEYAARVLNAEDALKDARRIELAGHPVALLDETVPELPEAALRTGTPFIAPVRERGGRWKWVLQAAPPEVVEEFMKDPGLDGRLMPQSVAESVRLYGDPARGFAGAPLPEGYTPKICEAAARRPSSGADHCGPKL